MRFSTFLFESEFTGKAMTMELGKPKQIYWHHNAQVGKHNIHIAFSPHHDRGFHVDYDINKGVKSYSGYSRADSGVEKHEAPAVMSHVSGTVHKFINEKKPKSLHFTAHDKDKKVEAKKHKMYQHFAQHLADVHGGEVIHHPADQTSFLKARTEVKLK